MHITEGIIVGKAAALYTAAGASLVAWGVSRMKAFVKKAPENRPLLGMGTALVFFVSLLPIPAFTGTCSHPCGTPLIGILLGPVIGIALTGISLLLQAAFFAHGGFSTWGANVVALGLCGCGFGWGAFRLARRLGLPLWAAGGAGGLAGDLMVYAASGLILGTALAQAPAPQFSLSGYLLAIYAAYLPTQLPIAVGEMLVTGLALHYASRQRPEVLMALGPVGPGADQIFGKFRHHQLRRRGHDVLAGLHLPFRGNPLLAGGDRRPKLRHGRHVVQRSRGLGPQQVHHRLGRQPGLVLGSYREILV